VTGPQWFPETGGKGKKGWWMVVLGILIAIALVGLIVFLHLSGTIGPGTHQAKWR
jgi:hypothetical protein